MTVRLLWKSIFPSAASYSKHVHNSLSLKQRVRNRSISKYFGVYRFPVGGAILAMFWLRFAFCRDGSSSIPRCRHHIYMDAKNYVSMFTKRESSLQHRTFAPYQVPSLRHQRNPSLNSAFVRFPALTHAFFSTKTKTRTATATSNRWKSPVLHSNFGKSEKPHRPPRLFKRTHLKVKKEDDLSDEKLYRADRVLSNRTGKSRKECFQLLQERRVFILTDEIYTDPKRNDSKRISSGTGSTAAVDETSASNKENRIQQYRLEVITGPAVKLSMHTPLRIDKYQEVALPPPLLMVYHKPKVTFDCRMCLLYILYMANA